MARVDELYHRLALELLEQGYWYEDKSRGQRCKQLSSLTIDFEIENSFPLLTTKKMFTKGIVGELIWFLRGDRNILYLLKNGVHIWDKDAYNWYKKMFPVSNTTLEEFPQEVLDYEGNYNNVGDVGRNYGVQWRDWRGEGIGYIEGAYAEVNYERIDQMSNLIKGLKDNPMSRRHIVTAWNPAELNETALPPCHWSFEIIPRPAYEFEKEMIPELEYCFTLKWHQRSVDTFLGLPFNIASYALLAKIIQELTGYKALGLIGDLSNVHFYEGHIEDVRTQLKNDPTKYKSCSFELSERIQERFQHFRDGQATLDEILNEIEIKDFEFKDYESYPAIKADMYEPKIPNK